MKTKTVLTPKVLEVVRASAGIRKMIAEKRGITNATTVWRWANTNSEQLCLPDVLKIIKANITLPKGESYTIEIETKL